MCPTLSNKGHNGRLKMLLIKLAAGGCVRGHDRWMTELSKNGHKMNLVIQVAHFRARMLSYFDRE